MPEVPLRGRSRPPEPGETPPRKRCPGEIQDRQIDAETGRSGHATLTGTRLPAVVPRLTGHDDHVVEPPTAGGPRRILRAMTAASSAPGSANPPRAVGRLVAVNVGLPRDVAWRGRTVHTGVWKEPVDGPRMVRYLNVDGDGQGDLAGHGGPHRAVLVYQLDSYAYWRRQLGLRRRRVRAVRRELHRRGAPGRRGVHRRPVRDRCGAVRGEPAPGHLLPRRPASRRAAAAGAARGAPAAGVLPAGPARGGGRGRRPDRQGANGPGADDRRRGRRPAVPARSRP